jgi:hypothetical protein
VEKPALARDVGILVHGVQEVFYLSGGLDGAQAKADAENYFDEQRVKAFENSDSMPREMIKDLQQRYDLSWRIATGYWDWLEEYGGDSIYENMRSEEKLSMPGPVDSILNGRLDLLADDKESGDIVVIDFKVVASIEGMIKTLGMSEQGLQYGLLAKINHPGRQVRVVWSMMKRSMRTGRAKPPFYQRYDLAINDDMIRQYYEQLHGQITEMLRLESMLNDGHKPHVVAYPSPNSECSWKCQFFTVCGLMNDPRNDVEWMFEEHFTQRDRSKQEHQVSSEETAVPVTIST